MGEHARLGYSNKRWPMCPASPDQEAKYENISGPAAIDGTGTHLLVELCLINGVKADEYLGQVIGEDHEDKPSGWVVNVDRSDRANVCLDYVERRTTELKQTYPEAEVKAESRSNVGSFYGREDWWGTSDIVIIARDAEGLVSFIEIIDYKDGRGYVHANDNSQLMGNLGGWLLDSLETVEAVRMTIVQPRTSNPIRFQDTNPAYVKSELDKLAAAAAKTDEPNPEYVPDELLGKGHCAWCLHRNDCKALARKQQEPLMSTDLNIIPSLDLGNLSSVSSDELVKLARKEKDLKIAFSKITKELEKRFHAGEEIEGTAFESVSSKRVWSKSDDEIRKMLKNRKVNKDLYDIVTLAGPAKVLALECLTPKQKATIEEEFVCSVMGTEKFVIKPVPKTKEKTKPSALEMFGGVKPAAKMPNFK